jgi:hypothetical protein
MKKLHKWHQTKVGLLVFGLIELGLAYGFASLAIDRGGPWWYLLALIFLVGALQNLFKLIRKLINGGR